MMYRLVLVLVALAVVVLVGGQALAGHGYASTTCAPPTTCAPMTTCALSDDHVLSDDDLCATDDVFPGHDLWSEDPRPARSHDHVRPGDDVLPDDDLCSQDDLLARHHQRSGDHLRSAVRLPSAHHALPARHHVRSGQLLRSGDNQRPSDVYGQGRSGAEERHPEGRSDPEVGLGLNVENSAIAHRIPIVSRKTGSRGGPVFSIAPVAGAGDSEGRMRAHVSGWTEPRSPAFSEKPGFFVVEDSPSVAQAVKRRTHRTFGIVPPVAEATTVPSAVFGCGVF